MELSLEFKRNVLLIFKEALSNIQKHAEATCTEIHLRFLREHFEIAITDDGKGFSTTHSTGSGLMNMRRRAKSIGAELLIDSKIQAGTIIKLKAKITQ